MTLPQTKPAGRQAPPRYGISHQPFRKRERAMLRFRRMHSLQKFAAVHLSVFNRFNSDRSLSSSSVYKMNRFAALAERRALCAA